MTHYFFRKGTDEQVAKLAEYQALGQIGCFSLTEQLAGVQSGLVVETTATWDQAKNCFLLNTPHAGMWPLEVLFLGRACHHLVLNW